MARKPAAQPNPAARRLTARLKGAIVLLNTTQRKVARASRLDETRMSDIVRARVEATDDEKSRIAKVLKQTVDALFHDKPSSRRRAEHDSYATT